MAFKMEIVESKNDLIKNTLQNAGRSYLLLTGILNMHYFFYYRFCNKYLTWVLCLLIPYTFGASRFHFTFFNKSDYRASIKEGRYICIKTHNQIHFTLEPKQPSKVYDYNEKKDAACTDLTGRHITYIMTLYTLEHPSKVLCSSQVTWHLKPHGALYWGWRDWTTNKANKPHKACNIKGPNGAETDPYDKHLTDYDIHYYIKNNQS